MTDNLPPKLTKEAERILKLIISDEKAGLNGLELYEKYGHQIKYLGYDYVYMNPIYLEGTQPPKELTLRPEAYRYSEIKKEHRRRNCAKAVDSISKLISAFNPFFRQ